MSPRKVISLWPSVQVLADDLSEKSETVRKWRARGIPAKHYPRLVKAAKKRRLGLTLDDLHGMAA